MDPVNDFLISYLDAIDEQLLEYLDDDGEMKLDVVKRLRLRAPFSKVQSPPTT